MAVPVVLVIEPTVEPTILSIKLVAEPSHMAISKAIFKG